MITKTLHKYSIELLSPLHIGSGEESDAFNCAIVNNELICIDENRVLEKCTGEDREKLLSRAKTPGLYSKALGRIASKLEKEHAGTIRYRMALGSGAGNLFHDSSGKITGSFPAVHQFIRSANQPYLPATSFKGALRTALLYNKAVESGPVSSFNDRKFQAETLRYQVERGGRKVPDFSRDPLSAVYIIDGDPISEEQMVLEPVVVLTKKSGHWNEKNFFIPLEAARTGTVIIISLEIIEKKLPMKLGEADFATAARRFTGDIITKEMDFARGDHNLEKFYSNLKTIHDNLQSNQFLLRLGWASGYDAMSMNLARKTREEKISRRVIREGHIPLGWVHVTSHKQ